MADLSIDDVQAHMTMIRARAAVELRGKVIAVWSPKGGVGKSTIAPELAMVLGAVLCDLDHDAGGATRAMGHMVEKYARIPILDAIREDKAPVLWRKSNRPALIPSHPELETAKLSTELVQDSLVSWAKELDQCLVVDLHPGNGDVQFGAINAADVILSPLELATKELNAVENMLKTLAGYPLYLIPNMIEPGASTAAEVDRLRNLATHHDVPIGPVVKRYPWVARRKLQTMICGREVSNTTFPFVADMVRVAEGVLSYALAS